MAMHHFFYASLDIRLENFESANILDLHAAGRKSSSWSSSVLLPEQSVERSPVSMHLIILVCWFRLAEM